MTPNATARPEDRLLRRVMQVDAWVSFSTPAIFLLCVPVLAVADVPGWLVTTVVLVAAVILGGCGIVMAGVCAVAVARGRLEFPDQYALEHFNLVGPAARRTSPAVPRTSPAAPRTPPAEPLLHQPGRASEAGYGW